MTSAKRNIITLAIAAAGLLSLGCVPYYDGYYGYAYTYDYGYYGPSSRYTVVYPRWRKDADWGKWDRSYDKGRRDAWCDSGSWSNRRSWGTGGGWSGSRGGAGSFSRGGGGGGGRWSRR